MNKILETKRLILREFIKEDVINLYQLDNNPQVMKYISSYKGEEKSKDDCKKVIEKQIDYYKTNKGLGIWPTILKENNDFIGWTTLKYLENTNNVEIGYRYLPEYWNNGYATEMCQALINYGFNQIGLDEIVAVAMPENIASRRVMEKIGMKFIKEDFYYYSKVVLYSIRREFFKG